MTLEEEKKLVAEKLMGWSKFDWVSDTEYRIHGQGNFDITHWHPDTERKWWPDIIDKMDKREIDIFWYDLKGVVERPINWQLKLPKPSVCWKALILTLGDTK